MNWGLRLLLLLMFTLSLALELPAQIKRGNRLFASGEYYDCILAYERGLRHKKDGEAMERLANAYRITHNYTKAEEWYSKAIATNPNISPVAFLWYGTVLKTNGKPAEARVQFQNFMRTQPNNKRAEAELKSIDRIKTYTEETRLYEIAPANGWNTEYSDFGVTYGNKGVFLVSDRGAVDILNENNAAATNGAYYSIYFCQEKTRSADSATYGSISKLPYSINTEFHNGPLSLSSDYKMMAFTRIDQQVRLRSKKFINRGKIYFSTALNKGWSKPVPFTWNSDTYSCLHPSLSGDGKLLFFASDMPGSIGEMDIWVSQYENNTWTQPVNLGSVINSSGNELFPYLRKDGTLFFSSDGHAGLGGLDIFSSNKGNNLWTEPYNQGAPLNSAADDFSIVFDENNINGYFSSNRSGGKGLDDIYKFTLAGKFITLNGKLLTSKSPSSFLPNTKIQLLNERGEVVRSVVTDAEGKFSFLNVPAGVNYIAKLDEKDPAIQKRSKYYVADENNRTARVTVSDGIGGFYTFKNFPIDPQGPTQLYSDEDNLTIAGNLIAEGSPPKPLSNTKINLKDENGNIVQAVTTNAFGAFTFSNIPPDRSYIVSIDSAEDVQLNAYSKVIITDKSGRKIMSSSLDAKGNFKFEILKTDRNTISAMDVEDSDLRMDMRGTLAGADSANTLIANASVSIVDEDGIVLQTVKTDSKGNFRFTNLPADRAYMVRVEDVEDPALTSLGKIFVKDAKGKITNILTANGKNFEFRILPADRATLGYVYVEDPWLEVMQMKAKTDSMLIIENIYYDLNDYRILPSAELILSKVTTVMKNDPSITIEISSHTDARSSNDYNKNLSQKRAQAVIDYLNKRGIDKKRLVAIGYGETRLLNKCSDGVTCTEEEHAKNRRTEFKINKK